MAEEQNPPTEEKPFTFSFGDNAATSTSTEGGGGFTFSFDAPQGGASGSGGFTFSTSDAPAEAGDAKGARGPTFFLMDPFRVPTLSLTEQARKPPRRMALKLKSLVRPR